jgi:hypothetical protein
MNLGLAYRDQIGQLSSWVQEELERLVAAMQAGWNVEHDPDGHHTAITGQTATLTGRLTAQGLAFPPAAIVTIDVTTAGTVVVPLVRASHLRITSSAGATRIDGVDGTRYQVGDVVVLSNASDDGGAVGNNLTLRLQSTTAATDMMFRGNPGTPDADVVLAVGRLVVLIRDKNSNGVRQYWRVSHF